jgi:hypothetical protein
MAVKWRKIQGYIQLQETILWHTFIINFSTIFYEIMEFSLEGNWKNSITW